MKLRPIVLLALLTVACKDKPKPVVTAIPHPTITADGVRISFPDSLMMSPFTTQPARSGAIRTGACGGYGCTVDGKPVRTAGSVR